MSREGYVKLWRKIWNNPLMRKPAYFSVFCWMLSEAAHGVVRENGKWRRARPEELPTVIINGKRTPLRPGQFTAGVYQISEATGVPRGTVERIVKRLKTEEQIEVQTTNKFSLYTITNWKQYQMTEEENEEQMRNKRGTNEEQMRTPEECKNVKNEKKVHYRPETEELLKWISGRCAELGLESQVSARALDVYVCRYIGKIKMRVELDHYLAWMVDNKKRVLRSSAVGNCFRRAQDFQKKTELKNLQRQYDEKPHKPVREKSDL